MPCLPVKPWHMTLVFLSIHTFAVDDNDLVDEGEIILRSFSTCMLLTTKETTSENTKSFKDCCLCITLAYRFSRATNRSITRVGGVIGAQCSVKLRSFNINFKNLFYTGRSRKKVGVEVVQGSKYAMYECALWVSPFCMKILCILPRNCTCHDQ